MLRMILDHIIIMLLILVIPFTIGSIERKEKR
jgi:hypothetical protein